jgi:hypothetical protein
MMSRIDVAFGALMASEEYCEAKDIEFDIWIAAERVAREYGVPEQDLIDAYDDHCTKWRAEKRLERIEADDTWDLY